MDVVGIGPCGGLAWVGLLDVVLLIDVESLNAETEGGTVSWAGFVQGYAGGPLREMLFEGGVGPEEGSQQRRLLWYNSKPTIAASRIEQGLYEALY